MIPRNVKNLAYAEALSSTHKFRLGAVVYHKQAILGSGCNNHLKTHPKSPHPYKTIHAEFAAIIDALGNNWPDSVSNSSLYVVRVKADGSLGYAKPCKYCQFMLAQVGIKKSYWSGCAEDKQ